MAKELEIKKIEEIVQLCKTRKEFLDKLAVSAGKKQEWVKGTQVPISAIQKSIQKPGKASNKKAGGDGFFMTSVNTKKGAVDFRGGEEAMDDINEDDEELDDSSFALRDRSEMNNG